MGILVALRLLHDSAIHFIFSLSFLHFFLVLLISHVFHFLTVSKLLCQKVKAENPNFSVLLGKNFCFWQGGKRIILTCWIQSSYCHGVRTCQKELIGVSRFFLLWAQLTYSSRWLKRKWVIVKKRSALSPITETNMRFRTKKQAQKEARQLNKGSSVKHLVRKVGWRRKRWHS